MKLSYWESGSFIQIQSRIPIQLSLTVVVGWCAPGLFWRNKVLGWCPLDLSWRGAVAGQHLSLSWEEEVVQWHLPGLPWGVLVVGDLPSCLSLGDVVVP